MNALSRIRNIDYTVIFARDMPAMRRFYEEVMRFPIDSEPGLNGSRSGSAARCWHSPRAA
jgi:catechol 2,3-dioxygenase-like lactoylglutathione lyase family enzyme